MNTITQDLLTRILASLKHLHTLHGPCDDSPSGDGAPTCPLASVIVELENLLFTEQPSPPFGETFSDSQIGSAIYSFLQYGEETFVGEGEPKQFGQRGYFSGEGWAARCLRFHLFQREGKRALEDLRNSLKNSNHDPRSWGKDPDPNREASLKDARDPDPPFQAAAPFPCEEPTQPLSHDPHDLASAILSTMAAGGTIHTAFPRLCAACGADIPATEHPDTNLCGRCAQ